VFWKQNLKHLSKVGLTGKELEQVVEQAVEKKLKPVMQMLSDLSDPGPRISDILGGIGYIIGLVGIGAYFKNRKKADLNTDDSGNVRYRVISHASDGSPTQDRCCNGLFCSDSNFR
jgi:hypothetical protein